MRAAQARPTVGHNLEPANYGATSLAAAPIGALDIVEQPDAEQLSASGFLEGLTQLG